MHKKRGYQREIPNELVRDYRLFAIACEGGVRERDYFRSLEYLSNRIKVDVIENEEEEDARDPISKSAPQWVLDRAAEYVRQNALTREDQLWFVLDKDRWTDEQLRNISNYCDEKQNWYIVVSNPCFEVWLYFHFESDITKSTSQACRDFKREIADLRKGGYHRLEFIGYMERAINNARIVDNDPDYFLPKHKQTKVYKLGAAILEFAGQNAFNNFVQIEIPRLMQREKEEIKSKKRNKTKSK